MTHEIDPAINSIGHLLTPESKATLDVVKELDYDLPENTQRLAKLVNELVAKSPTIATNLMRLIIS